MIVACFYAMQLHAEDDKLEEVLELARITASVTYNHPESVKGTLPVEECVFICREAADLEIA